MAELDKGAVWESGCDTICSFSFVYTEVIWSYVVTGCP